MAVFVDFCFRPGSVIVYFILYFEATVTPDKGIENLRVAISSNGTFGDFQAKDLVLHSEERTRSTTTTGIKGLSNLSINVIELHASSLSHSPLSLSLFYSSSSVFDLFLVFFCSIPSSYCLRFLHSIITIFPFSFFPLTHLNNNGVFSVTVEHQVSPRINSSVTFERFALS